MNNDEVMEKYGISKRLGIGIMLQMLLMIAALILTIVGIINNTNLHRAIIYIGQAAACILIIVFGVFRSNHSNRKFLRIVFNSYALL